ncbi:MAG: helix-turn-helix domain-containing protein [Microthrixaceae bacterium]
MPAETDRRTRKRLARRRELLDIAADLWDEGGPEAVTLAAIGERADLTAPSLYTYFPSKSAIVAALQREALEVLAQVAREAVASWRPAANTPAETVALARLVAFSDLTMAAPVSHPREFGLQQRLMGSPGLEDPEDAAGVIPAAFGALAVPARLIDEAVEVGAIDPVDSGDGPGRSDSSIVRAVRWLAALHGVLATDALPVGVPVDGHTLGRLLSGDLLRGWGAQPDRLAGATALADHWSTR